MFDELRALFDEILDIADAFNALSDLEPEEKARTLIALRRDYSEKNSKAAPRPGPCSIAIAKSSTKRAARSPNIRRNGQPR